MSSKRSKGKLHHIVIQNDEDTPILLYTKKMIMKRNKNAICLGTLGLQLCLLLLYVSIRRASFDQTNVYFDTLNNTLLCDIIKKYNMSYKFTLINARNTLCNITEYSVWNIDDEILLDKSNVSIGSVMECYTHQSECDYIHFVKGNIEYNQSSTTNVFLLVLICIGCITCVITVVTLFVTIRKDKYIFYASQWHQTMDTYSKFEYIMDKWIRQYNVHLCNDINDIIFDYTNDVQLWGNYQYMAFVEEGSISITNSSHAH